jgi:hypothetical protein
MRYLMAYALEMKRQNPKATERDIFLSGLVIGLRLARVAPMFAVRLEWFIHEGAAEKTGEAAEEYYKEAKRIAEEVIGVSRN